MRTWAILTVALGFQISSRASEENVRTFRPIDLPQLEAKVPRGFGKIFVEAGRANNLDPLILAVDICARVWRLEKPRRSG